MYAAHFSRKSPAFRVKRGTNRTEMNVICHKEVTHFRQKASGQIFKDDVDSFPSSLDNFASCSVPFEVVYVLFNDKK